MIPANQDCSHTLTRTLNKNGQNDDRSRNLSIFPLCTQKILFRPTLWTLVRTWRNMEGCRRRGAREQFPIWIQSHDFSQVTWPLSVQSHDFTPSERTLDAWEIPLMLMVADWARDAVQGTLMKSFLGRPKASPVLNLGGVGPVSPRTLWLQPPRCVCVFGLIHTL